MTARRLPVYILLDTSGSMKGEPIQSVNVGLDAMVNALRQDPFALESVYISIITFDIEAKEFLPLTPLEKININTIKVPDSGPTFMGAGINLLISSLKRNLKINKNDSKGDWSPLLFLMTDGSPSDIQDYDIACKELKKFNFANIIACAAGPKAKEESLRKITDQVFSLDIMDQNSFISLFKWVSSSVSMGSKSMGLDNKTLPPPPAEVKVNI